MVNSHASTCIKCQDVVPAGCGEADNYGRNAVVTCQACRNVDKMKDRVFLRAALILARRARESLSNLTDKNPALDSMENLDIVINRLSDIFGKMKGE